VGDPHARGSVAQQGFASPDGSVGAVTRAVPGQAQDWSFQAVLGNAGRDVGLVMLNRNQRHVPGTGQTLGVPRRCIIGVQIARHGRRDDAEELNQIFDRSPVDLDARRRVQVADVRRHDDRRTETQGHRILQMAAHGQNGGQVPVHSDR